MSWQEIKYINQNVIQAEVKLIKYKIILILIDKFYFIRKSVKASEGRLLKIYKNLHKFFFFVLMYLPFSSSKVLLIYQRKTLKIIN